MQNKEFPQSPCSKKCIIDPKTKFCTGCFRTIEEIIKWINLTTEEKNTIMKKAEKRRTNALLTNNNS
jgi:hypothetical protein